MCVSRPTHFRNELSNTFNGSRDWSSRLAVQRKKGSEEIVVKRVDKERVSESGNKGTRKERIQAKVTTE